MTKRHPDDPKPTWFRLSAESWAMIRAEYLDGATARQLAKKYRISPTSIYRHACQEGWTKEAMAEAVSRKSVSDMERQAAEAAARAQRQDDEMNALVQQIASSEDAGGIAAAIERRALAQASAAMVQGRSKEAQALASMAEMMRRRVPAVAATPLAAPRESVTPHAALSPEELERRALAQAGAALEQGKAGDAKALTAIAEQMRKRAEEDREAEKAAEEAVVVDKANAENVIMEIFARSAQIASCMVHHPGSAPAAFLRMIKRWREINLGEGEEELRKRARRSWRRRRRVTWMGSWEENLPEDVKAYLRGRWLETRTRLEAG